MDKQHEAQMFQSFIQSKYTLGERSYIGTVESTQANKIWTHTHEACSGKDIRHTQTELWKDCKSCKEEANKAKPDRYWKAYQKVLYGKVICQL